jgi:hypothetical protein
VKDTLEVSDKLNEVRGAIEERQAEFEALSKQVETVAINITLRAEADAILLWLFTILAGASVGWRILKWAARRLFIFAENKLG